MNAVRAAAPRRERALEVPPGPATVHHFAEHRPRSAPAARPVGPLALLLRLFSRSGGGRPAPGTVDALDPVRVVTDPRDIYLA